MNKKELRILYRKKRDALSEQEREQKDQKILSYLLEVEGQIASYQAFGSEVDICLLEKTKNIYYPKVINERLVFYQWSASTVFQTHPFGMKEPTTGYERDQFDVMLIPLLAYTNKGKRLGYGKGYYDRFLHTQSGIKIGVAYALQEVAEFLEDEWDVRLDGVVTEDGFLFFEC